MNDDQFTKLLRYIEEFRAEMNQKLDAKADKADVDRILEILDHDTDSRHTTELELAALTSKTDRLETYVHVLADKTGTDLTAIHV